MNIALHCREAARHCGSAARRSSFVVAAVAALAAAPASATWTVTDGLNTDGTTTDNFYATDSTWDLKFTRSGNGTYNCKNNSGTGGATLDLTGAAIAVTNPEDMPKDGCTIATSASGGIVSAAPRKLSGELAGYSLFLTSTKARIGKPGFIILVR